MLGVLSIYLTFNFYNSEWQEPVFYFQERKQGLIRGKQFDPYVHCRGRSEDRNP